jgi:hypothetical protein
VAIVSWIGWSSRWLPVIGLAVTLLAAIDPLEGFPVVLLGGVLLVMTAVQEKSAHTRLIVAGLVVAALGCAVMVVLSLMGGVGGGTGRSLWWLAFVAPYPIGVIAFVVGAVLMLRARRAGDSARGQ